VSASRPALPPPPRVPTGVGPPEAETIAGLALCVGRLEGEVRTLAATVDRLATGLDTDRALAAKALERIAATEGELRAAARRSGGGIAVVVSAVVAAIGHVIAGK
jgi:hypothetical protein